MLMERHPCSCLLASQSMRSDFIMGWATHAIEQLKAGSDVTIRPRGNSMRGRVEDGQTVVVKPCLWDDLSVNDVVLCRVKGHEYLHLIKAIDGARCLIGNNKDGVNGWVGRASVFGRVDV